MLDPETIDNMSREEHEELLDWLETLVKYVKMKLGIETETKPKSAGHASDDPVGDLIILDHKKRQDKSSSWRKPSGWTSVGFDRNVDDKHV